VKKVTVQNIVASDFRTVISADGNLRACELGLLPAPAEQTECAEGGGGARKKLEVK
jgi:hypothetical protein